MTDTDIPSLIDRLRNAALVLSRHPSSDADLLMDEAADALSRLTSQLPEGMEHCTIRLTVNPPAINIAHIKAFATCMTRDNWADMQDHILRQIEELSRLTASPLPEEIAGLIERAKERIAYHDRVAATISNLGKPRADNDAGRTAQLIEELAAAFQQMAWENERLEEIVTARDQQLTAEIALSSKFARQYDESITRIRELEGENDTLRSSVEAVRAEYLQRYMNATICAQKLRETLSAMDCPRQLNAGTIAHCTEHNQCSCKAGAVFVKTRAA